MSTCRFNISPSCYREVNIERLLNEIWMYRKAHFLSTPILLLTTLAGKYLRAWEANPNIGLHSWLDDEHVNKWEEVFEGCDKAFNHIVDEAVDGNVSDVPKDIA